MTDDAAANIMGAVGTTASISVGLIGAGLAIQQVKNLERSTKPKTARKKRKRKK